MSELDGAYVAPNTAAEELVASIWEEVLQAERIGVHDNFFERGGHSLLATQVISRIEEAFGVDVPLRHLFELPTVAALAEQVQALQAAGHGRQVPPLLKAERVGPMPLSFAQQRLWLIDQLQPGSAVYNMPFVVRLEGELDVEALERSLEEIIARHEALRTTFVEGPAEPLQVIAAPDRLSLAVRDLSSLPAEEREATARQLAQEEVAAPFDLSAGPLIRCSLLKLAEREHLLVLNMHHIVSDGWSTGVFLHEFAALYAAFADGRPSPLPALAIQYADYAVWQRNWLQGSALEEQLSYWKERLGGDLPALQLPTDRPRPPVQTHRGAVVSAELSPELAQALQALSKRQGVTLFMTLLAAFQTMLARYTGQEDIAVGTPIAGRNAKETEELIGFFVNTLVMRTDLSGEPTFREVLKRVREVALGAYANQDVPFERLVEELQPPRDTSRTPLFQTMFVLQNDALPAVEVEGLLIEPLDISNETAKFDLTLFVQGEQDELVAMFEYNTDLFEASTARRMIDHFHNLLHEIAADPDRSISRYSLLAERERDTLLLEWNDTKREHGEEKTFAQLFEAQAEKTPDAVAVELSAESWTYRELNEQANRLAHLLKRYGVGPDVIVGIFLDRSLAMMAAFLAVFKAGGAYLPLDPSTPPERMSFLLQDAGAALVLTTSTLGDRVPASDLPQIVLDGQADLIAGQPADNLAPVAEPGHLAYLIYTSGSTGLPKGTMIEQRGLTNYLLWAVDAYRLQEGAGAIVHSSVAFDMPITSLFPPLLTGKKVVFTPQEASGVEALCQLLLTRQDFSLVKVTPAHLQLLNRELEGEDWQGLARALVIGGEALLPEQVAPWQERAPETRLINEYGPTETVVGCCVHEVSEADRGGAIPIGRPIANMAMYILDAQQQPVPIGVVGEIYIGGHGVARGYRNREELQAERFLPDPFRAEEAAKLYRTGDLASYRADGAIEYVGRIDSQVKIRGYRIELGEVEAALYQHPAVREALVIDREDIPGNRRLVAYLVAGEKLVAGREIRAFLKRFLSEYMIPSDFVWLEEIPLTANGKVDHKVLPTPSADLEREERETAPRDRLEMQLVRIWEAVLGRSNIGVRDNFFELGGHSLLALQVLKEIEARLEQKVSLTALIQSGTIEQLAALLRDGEASDHRVPTLLPLRANGTQRPLFLVHPIGGHATSYVELAKALGEDQPVYALQSPGLEGECEPLDRIEDMAAHYLAEIRAVQPVGPYLLGGWSFGGAVAYEMAQQLRAAGEEVALLALLDSAVPKLNRRTEAELEEGALALQFAADLAGRFGIDVTPFAEEFAEKGAEETLDAVLELAQRHHALAPSFERADLKRLFDVFRANAIAYQQYEPQPFDREVVLFRAEAGPSALIEDQSLGYGELVQEVDVHVMSGDHFTLLQTPNVTQLASRLQTVLERVKKTETTS
ncbi:amino acid adenylation domain-containing protein [Tumebacillus lipolyticus]|uniref:Amino acid adenylation domain-containing protein n=1 Tax=Tumebacillus lipolyticus TaxID=1280370 RepID=A0ABW4ZZE0_9BACL